MLRSWVELMVAHRAAVLATVFAVSLFFAFEALQLRVEVDPDQNIPQDHPYIQALNRLEEVFGEKNLVMVGLFPHDRRVFTPRFLAKIERITRRLAALPGAIPSALFSIAAPQVKSIAASPEGMEVTPLLAGGTESAEGAEAVRARVHANPFFLDTLVARDDSAVAIFANFELTPATPGYAQLYSRIEETLASEDDGTFAYHLAGPVVVVAELSRQAARMALFFPLAVLVIGLVHYEAFRTLQGLFLPLLTALLSVAWALGIMGALRVSLDPYNVTTPILILAVAAGHAVQILKRYYEELARLGDPRAAVVESTTRAGKVTLAAAGVAALSFMSLATFRTTAIRNFGIFTALGIASAAVLELTLIPALRAVLPPGRRELRREAARHSHLDAALAALARTVAARPRAVVAIGGVLLLVAASAARPVRVDMSFLQQFSPQVRVVEDDRILNRTFGGTSTLVFLVEGDEHGALEEPAVLRAIDRLERKLSRLPGVGKGLSVVDYLERMHAAMHGDDPRYERVPESRALVAQYLLLYSLSGGPDDFLSYLDSGHRLAKVRFLVHDDSQRYGRALIARAHRAIARIFPPGYRVLTTGTVASLCALTEVMVKGKLWNILQIAAIIVAVSAVLLGSLVGGLLVAVPLVLAVAVNFAAMGLLGIPLNAITSTISAMAVGIGADYAIYLVYRLREELGRSPTEIEALERTLTTSGQAIVFVASAVAAGYAILCLSGFRLHVQLGGLVALAMLVSSLAALSLLPAALFWWRPAFLFPPSRAGDSAAARRSFPSAAA